MAVLGAPVVVDGSHGEGGPALLRTALSMAAATEQGVRIEFVRGGMPAPGLKAEDLAILRALQQLTQAEVEGGELGSTTVSFQPSRPVRGQSLRIDPPDDESGPGSVNALVVLNALVPLLARSGVYTAVSAIGETYGNHVLSYDYFANVTLGAYRKLGLYAFSESPVAGFGRMARGMVQLEIEPSAFEAFEGSRRGRLLHARAIVAYGDVSDGVGQRAVAHLARLAYFSKIGVEPEASRVKSDGPGAHVTVWAEFESGLGGATAMGAKGVRIESVVQTAFEAFAQWYATDATVDAFLADQILVATALCGGKSTFSTPSVTARLLTAIWVVKQFLPIHITLRGHENEPGVVTISV